MNGEQQHSEQQLLDSVRNALDAQQSDLSPAVTARLHQARKQAVAVAQQPRKAKPAKSSRLLGWDNFWQPLAPFATAAATFAGVIFYLGVVSSVPVINTAWEEDTELLFSADDFDLYEDLDFYAWLAETENG